MQTEKNMAGPYEIIVLDLDGTLTNRDKVVTPRTKAALMKAQERGKKVVLASGRPTQGVMPLAKELRLDEYSGYILSFNGGRIINCKTGETVFARSLPVSANKKIIGLAEDCQQIHPPIILTLGSREALMLEKNMKIFTDIGFEIEPFGGKEYAVRGVPDNLFSIARKELLMEMLDSLSEDAQARNADMIYEKVASMSCKAAVKGHDVLSAAEADALIDQLLGLENPYACPHGRPTIISMSKYELEKKFKRIV